MNAQSLCLPQTTSCPACGKLLEQVRVALVFTEETGELEAVVVVCPYCDLSYAFDVKTIARAAALEAVEQLHHQI